MPDFRVLCLIPEKVISDSEIGNVTQNARFYRQKSDLWRHVTVNGYFTHVYLGNNSVGFAE
jgi:hypothetical protein